MKRQYLIIILLIIIITACTSDSEEALVPESKPILYSEEVKPVLDSHCNTCHSSYVAPNLYTMPLDVFDSVKVVALDGSLVGSISWDEGYSPMPFEYQLDQLTLNKIKQWVEQGALNN